LPSGTETVYGVYAFRRMKRASGHIKQYARTQIIKDFTTKSAPFDVKNIVVFFRFTGMENYVFLTISDTSCTLMGILFSGWPIPSGAVQPFLT